MPNLTKISAFVVFFALLLTPTQIRCVGISISTVRAAPIPRATSVVLLSWNQSWGGFSLDDATGLAIDAGNNLFITGQTFSFTAGMQDLFLAKFNSSGLREWNVTLGGTGSDRGNDIAMGPNGDLLIAGQVSSWGAGGIDVLYAKFDKSGSKLWNYTWGTSGAEMTAKIDVGKDGCFYICGSNGSTDMAAFLVKFNSEGIQLWNRTWQNATRDSAADVAVDGDNHVYLVGSTNDTMTGKYNAFIAKYDTNGGSMWNQTLGGVEHDYATSIVLNPEGNLIFLGTSNSTGSGTRDFLLAKYTPDGTQLWNSTWGRSGQEDTFDLAVDGDGNAFAVGYSSDPAGLTKTDFALVKFNAGGELLWNHTWGGSQDDVLKSVAVNGADEIFATGSSSSWGAGSGDAIIVKYFDPAPQISHPVDLSYMAWMFGNTIEWNATDETTNETTYTIYCNGSSVATGSWISGTAISLVVDGLTPGAYNYTIVVNDGLGDAAFDEVIVTVTENWIFWGLLLAGVCLVAGILFSHSKHKKNPPSAT